MPRAITAPPIVYKPIYSLKVQLAVCLAPRQSWHSDYSLNVYTVSKQGLNFYFVYCLWKFVACIWPLKMFLKHDENNIYQQYTKADQTTCKLGIDQSRNKHIPCWAINKVLPSWMYAVVTDGQNTPEVLTSQPDSGHSKSNWRFFHVSFH